MNERIFESFPELRTQRLFLRQITQEDDNNLFNVLSNEDTCAYLVHNAVVSGIIKRTESANKSIQ